MKKALKSVGTWVLYIMLVAVIFVAFLVIGYGILLPLMQTASLAGVFPWFAEAVTYSIMGVGAIVFALYNFPDPPNKKK